MLASSLFLPYIKINANVDDMSPPNSILWAASDEGVKVPEHPLEAVGGPCHCGAVVAGEGGLGGSAFVARA